MAEVLLWTLLTVLVFLAARWLNLKSGILLLNPLLICVSILGTLLLVFNIDYAEYERGTKPISSLIECAVVMLGYPFFKQLRTIAKEWHLLLAVCFTSSFLVIVYCVCLGTVLGVSETTIKSLVMMCTTTPIAMETASLIGGSPSLAAILVLVAGISGSVLGAMWMNLLKVSDERARGLATGATAHALGTATIAQISLKSAAYSSTALIMCAIITAVLAPALVPLLLGLF